MPPAKNPMPGVEVDAWGRRSHARMPGRLCTGCGNDFRPAERSTKFCSVACFRKHVRSTPRTRLPVAAQPPKPFTTDDIDSRSIPVPECGCFIWTGVQSSRGYGQLKHRGKSYSAHRVSWIASNGEIPPGMCVMHKCDTPMCVNPAHLKLGTQADNMADRDAKGRGARPGKKAAWTPFPARHKPHSNTVRGGIRAENFP